MPHNLSANLIVKWLFVLKTICRTNKTYFSHISQATKCKQNVN